MEFCLYFSIFEEKNSQFFDEQNSDHTKGYSKKANFGQFFCRQNGENDQKRAWKIFQTF